MKYLKLKKPGYSIIIIAAFAVISFGQTAAQLKHASVLFKQAVSDYNQGRYDETIRNYDQYLKIRPDVSGAWYNRGLAFYQKGTDRSTGNTEIIKGNIDKAVSDFSQAIRLDPKSEDYYIYRATSYSVIFVLDVEKYTTLAMADLSSAIELNPKSSENYRMRGDMHERAGNNDEAFSDYSRSIELDSKNTLSYVGRAKSYGYIGNFRLAKTDLDAALRLDPKNAKAKMIEEWINKEVKSEPVKIAALENWKTYSNRGKIYLEQRDPNNALASFEKALSMVPKQTGNGLPALLARLSRSEVLENIAKAYFQKNDLDRSIEYYISAQSDLILLFANSYGSDIRLIDFNDLKVRTTDIYIRHAIAIAELGRRGEDHFKLTTLTSAQKLQVIKLQIFRASSADIPAKLLHTNSVLLLRMAISCKTDVFARCGQSSSSNQILVFANRAHAEINKAIGYSPSLKMNYLQRAEVYRFLGKNDQAFADMKKAAQLKDN